MAIDTSSPRSRRALLSAVASATAAVVAQAVVPRSSVEAANGDPLVLGSATNAATATTKLTNNTNGLDVLVVETAEGTGVTVNASSGNGNGVRGNSRNGYAVAGAATTGIGVVGNATSGIGVAGFSDNRVGVDGYSPGGIGVHAKSGTGIALSVDGKVHFNRSGRTWIRAGHASLTVTQVGTAPNSRVFAVLASNRPSRYVRAVVPSTNAFTVYLNANALSDSVVTWFVLD